VNPTVTRIQAFVAPKTQAQSNAFRRDEIEIITAKAVTLNALNVEKNIMREKNKQQKFVTVRLNDWSASVSLANEPKASKKSRLYSRLNVIKAFRRTLHAFASGDACAESQRVCFYLSNANAPEQLQKFLVIFSAALLVLISVSTAFSQGKQAIVLMRSGNTTAANCDGASDMNYQTVFDLKLNTKDEIRLLNVTLREGVTPETGSVPRKLYEDSPKNKLNNMFQLKWQNGFLYAVAANGQTPFLVLPENMKPQKEVNTTMSQFYSVLLSGEVRSGKEKRKISLAIRDVWKIFFIPEGGNANDVLFNHAMEEKSVVVWEAFLQKTNNYRAAEANSNMRDVLIVCARKALDQFAGGDYRSLEVARQRTERAQSVKSDEATDKLMVEINQQKQRVNGIREQVFQLIGQSRWDDAIAAAEPIKIYLKTWEDLNSLYNDALKRSHEAHYSKGTQALQNNQLDVALLECTTAWQRLPDSTKARECVCTSRNKIALRDSGNYRQHKQPKLAKELLEKQLADGDCSRDEAVLRELGEAKREYAQQLYSEAKQLTTGSSAPPPPAPKGKTKTTPTPKVGALKAIAAQNKKDFREAREKLLLAENLSHDDSAKALLDKVNQSLSGYCVTASA
jgi:hypothetical protein